MGGQIILDKSVVPDDPGPFIPTDGGDTTSNPWREHGGQDSFGSASDWTTAALKAYGGFLMDNAWRALGLGGGMLGLGYMGLYNGATIADPEAAGIGIWSAYAGAYEAGCGEVLKWWGEQLLMEPPRWDCWSSRRPTPVYRPKPLHGGSTREEKHALDLARKLARDAERSLEAVEQAAAARLAGDGDTADFLSGQAVGWLGSAKEHSRALLAIPVPVAALSRVSDDALFAWFRARSRAAGETFHARIYRGIVADVRAGIARLPQAEREQQGGR